MKLYFVFYYRDSHSVGELRCVSKNLKYALHYAKTAELRPGHTVEVELWNVPRLFGPEYVKLETLYRRKTE